MNVREWFARADRLQKGRMFKLIASAAVVLLAVAWMVTYVVMSNAPGSELSGVIAEVERQASEAAAGEGDREGATGTGSGDRSVVDTGLRAAQQVLERGSVTSGVLVGTVLVAAILLVVIWLGLFLTYALLGLAAFVVAIPIGSVAGMPGLSRLVVGLTVLSAAFVALMQAARVALSGPGPIFAVAKNVLAEAVRMKVSLVFIVLLMFMLASLPQLLDPAQPLRYRVQAFLQYSTGGAFWVTALLVLFFSASTVTFEQRDRVIWQTVTKPVASWQYILGKWMGVVTLAAVLMAVCGTTIFMFTEYLRSQPAIGEGEAYVALGEQAISEDRLVLETQILAARVSAMPEPAIKRNDPEIAAAVQRYIENERLIDESFGSDEATVGKIGDDLLKQLLDASRSMGPGEYRFFTFTGLQRAASRESPLTLRYRVNMGSNRPDQTARLTFVINDRDALVREAGLGIWQTLSLTPAAITPQGEVNIRVFNADVQTGYMNPQSISFPPDGLQLSYSAGSYRMNFLRVMGVLMVKLAFLSMLTICVSTFVSFPVACLVSIGTFLMAESAGFLNTALESYWTEDREGKVRVFPTIAAAIANVVKSLFAIYAGLKPTTRLVDGELLSYGRMAGAIAVLGAWTMVLYCAAVVIFRRRELATYSGQ